MIDSIAVIGLGSISLRHRQNIKELFPQCTVVALSASGRRNVGDVDNADLLISTIEELIELKPYMAIVASPATSHVQFAIRLIEAGIPVLIEKPLAASAEQCTELLKVTQSSPVPSAVAYCLRYMPATLIIKSLLEQNQIGKIYSVSVNVGQYLPDWRSNKNYRDSVSAQASLGGGVLLELSHELDYLRWFLGDFTVAFAQLRNSEQLDLAVEEIADLVLISDVGVTCHVHMDFLQQSPQRLCSFVGEKARLDWDLLANTIIVHDANGTETLLNEPLWSRNEMYLTMLQDFIANIQAKQHRCVEIEDAFKTLTLIDSIKHQAQWGAKL
jgi:predicted dehydrogenase